MTRKKTYANISIGPLTPLLNLKIVVVLTNWTFQGLVYADLTEKLFKVSLDAILACAISVALVLTFPYGNLVAYVLLSLLVAHTMNWMFNGQIFALLKNFNLVYNEPEAITCYTEELRNRAAVEKSIESVLVYGSLARGEIKPGSDVDIRILRKAGLIHGLRACTFASRERFRAFISRFPLDIYVADSPKHLQKMRSDETPAILFRREEKGMGHCARSEGHR